MDNLEDMLRLLGPSQSRPRLLVVDDQPINIHVIHQVFAADHQVFMATSGEQALSVCRDNPPDLVLLDVVMPDLDGLQVCARLRADEATRHIPIIFVTGHSDPAEEARGLEAGAVDFIAKPINPQIVRARVRTQLTLKYQSDLLRQLAQRDGLTGVFNRRHFDERLDAECRRANRSAQALSLFMIDVDHFKRFNDRYGHQAGDDCLRQIAATLRATFSRGADVVARYGGEEFAVILPDTDATAARAIAARLLERVEALCIEHETSDVAKSVTVSLGGGVCLPSGHCRPGPLMALADAQLYRAKHAGRARAFVQEVPPEPA